MVQGRVASKRGKSNCDQWTHEIASLRRELADVKERAQRAEAGGWAWPHRSGEKMAGCGISRYSDDPMERLTGHERVAAPIRPSQEEVLRHLGERNNELAKEKSELQRKLDDAQRKCANKTIPH